MEVLQVKSELDQMLDLYRDRQPARVLEIGCWDGGTLREWLEQHTPDLVVAVDLEHRNKDAYEDWRHPATELVVCAGLSQSAYALQVMRDHAPYDWVFVDGDHGLDAVTADVEAVVPLIAPGGLLLLHDIRGDRWFHSDYPPKQVLDTFRATRTVWEFVEPGDRDSAHGIGVVQL